MSVDSSISDGIIVRVEIWICRLYLFYTGASEPLTCPLTWETLQLLYVTLHTCETIYHYNVKHILKNVS